MAQPTMKVVRYYPPGGIPQLKFQTESIPVLKEGEVLIRVHGVGIIGPELTWPIYQLPDGEYTTHIPGHDFSGTVAELGPGIDSEMAGDIQPGAEVIAFTSTRDKEGAMAQYAKAHITQVVLKPRGLGLADSASIPLSSLTAWQAFNDHSKVLPDHRVLITGAAGGTGIFAVQFAKTIGAHVVGTASSERSFEILRDLGIDEIIDYKKNPNWQDDVSPFDVILDTVGGEVLEQSIKVLKKDGTLLNINTYEWGMRAKAAGINGSFFIVSMNQKQLRSIVELFDKGLVKTVVDSVIPFENVQKGFQRAFERNVHGKIVLRVADL